MLSNAVSLNTDLLIDWSFEFFSNKTVFNFLHELKDDSSIIATFEGINSRSIELDENEDSSIHLNLIDLERSICVSLSQYENDFLPIDVTFDGIEISVTDEYENAFLLIVRNSDSSENSTTCKFLHW